MDVVCVCLFVCLFVCCLNLGGRTTISAEFSTIHSYTTTCAELRSRAVSSATTNGFLSTNEIVSGKNAIKHDNDDRCAMLVR